MKVMTYTVVCVVGMVAWRRRPGVTDGESAIPQYQERAKDACTGSVKMAIYNRLACAGCDNPCYAIGTCEEALYHEGWY